MNENKRFRPSLPLVKNLLERHSDRECDGWSYQGFGMYRLYLTRAVRLHVWMPDDAVPNVSTIHNHPWDFTSKILVGEMTNKKYEVVEGSSSPTHHMSEILCGPKGGITHRHLRDERVELRLCGLEELETGDAYRMARHELHESMITMPGTITMIERVFYEDTEHALVCYPLGTEWVSAEPRPATRVEISRMAEAALALVNAELGE